METQEQRPITVTYRSGTHPTQGWDTIQVIYSQDSRILNHFLLARDGAGTILRKTDVLLERWEIVTDVDDLRGFRKCFDERDRLALDQSNGLKKVGA